MDVTWEALEPILRSGWSGKDRAWECVLSQQPILDQAITVVIRKYRGLGLDPVELTQETLVQVCEKILREEGLVASDRGSNPAGWLFTVFKHKATERARRSARLRRRELLDSGDQGRGLEERSAQPTDEHEEGRVHSHDLHSQLRAHLEELNQIAPLRALAWILFCCPELLQLIHVVEAAQTTNRTAPGKTTGLLRSPEETWSRLVVWRDRYGRCPDDRHSRRMLAWIFRSIDPHDPETWRRLDPDGMRRGLDAIRKWAARARKDLGGLQ